MGLGDLLTNLFGGGDDSGVTWADDGSSGGAEAADGGESPAGSGSSDDATRDDAARDDAARADAQTEMAAEAAELAEYWSERGLDFSPESLSRLDDLVDEQWDKERFEDVELGDTGSMDGRVLTGLVTQLGSYFGEVLVRNLEAEWVEDDTMGTAVEVAAAGDDAAAAGDGADDSAGSDDGDTGSDDAGNDDAPQSATVNVFHVADDCLTEPSKFAMVYRVVVDETGQGGA